MNRIKQRRQGRGSEEATCAGEKGQETGASETSY
jgi:hypothetical protein